MGLPACLDWDSCYHTHPKTQETLRLTPALRAHTCPSVEEDREGCWAGASRESLKSPEDAGMGWKEPTEAGRRQGHPSQESRTMARASWSQGTSLTKH